MLVNCRFLSPNTQFISILKKCLLMVFLFLPIQGYSEESAEHDISILARDYLAYTLGRWEGKTTYFNEAGEEIGEIVEGFGEEVLVKNQINLHKSYNVDGTINFAFRFYSQFDGQFYIVDVTHQGHLWILSGEPGSEVWTSKEKSLANGKNAVLKITHYNIREEAFETLVEISYDTGYTWQKIQHQDYRKIGDNPEK